MSPNGHSPESKNQTQSQGQDIHLAGKSLEFYWRVAKFFILLLVVLEILNIVLEVHEYGSWVAEVAVFILFSVWLVLRFRIKLMPTITTAAFIGVTSGLVLAIFEIIWYHQWWYLLNLIRQPFIIAAVGMATSFVLYLLIGSLKTKKKNKEPKGGGIYGGKESSFKKFRQ
ncbi:hypothetical protein KKF61_04420 [Patescibacteria group bacterium]|nr:hypothetical protein [Patescibacteria group bacterium]MBU0963579.1 hypothetical protein [Patescibacteria group bacterium]